MKNLRFRILGATPAQVKELVTELNKNLDISAGLQVEETFSAIEFKSLVSPIVISIGEKVVAGLIVAAIAGGFKKLFAKESPNKVGIQIANNYGTVNQGASAEEIESIVKTTIENTIDLQEAYKEKYGDRD